MKGRAQGPPPRTGRRPRHRALPRRGQDHGAARPSAHPHILTLIDSGTAGGLLYYLDASADGSRLVYAGWNIFTLRVDVVPTSGGAAVPWIRTLSRDYKRATMGWIDKRSDAWMYRVVKP